MGLLRQFNLVLVLSCLAVLAQAGYKDEARHIRDQDLSELVPAITRSLDFLSSKTTTPRPHRPHYPDYPYYPEYPYPPPHYWPTERPTSRPTYRPTRPRPPYYLGQYPGSGHGYPYFIIINPGHYHPPPTASTTTTTTTTQAPPVGQVLVEGGDPNRRYVLAHPYNFGNEEYDDNTAVEEEIEEGEETARNVSVDGINISADSKESNDTETVDTKDVKLPLELVLGKSGKKVNDQVALVYLRNYKKGRQMGE